MTGKQSGFERYAKAMKAAARVALVAGMALLPMLAASTAQGQSFAVLYDFGFPPDSAGPVGNLVVDSAGNLFGEAVSGGLYGWGTLYELPVGGGEMVLYNFTGGSDGGEPYGGLVRGAGGSLLGITLTGGKFHRGCLNDGCGVVFDFTPQGTLHVLHTFSGGLDGGDPEAPLIADGLGNVYGTTVVGGLQGGCAGANGCGVVFKIDLQGHETVLHAFTGVPDGQAPLAPLVRDAAGNLYGSTADGGVVCSLSAGGCGVIFKVDSAGNETVLYSFTGSGDGAFPTTGLIRDSAGSLYATTMEGGNFTGNCAQFGCGVVFELEATGGETTLYAFTDGSDGALPETSLVRDTQGNLYGSTDEGGNFSPPCPSYGCGVIFKLSPSGKLDVLHTFDFTDGWQPSSALLTYKGNLYGTAGDGGSNGQGVIFKLQP